VEDRITGLEAEMSGMTGQVGGHEAALEGLAAAPPPPDANALRSEFSALLTERLDAFGQELAANAAPPLDVTPALGALSAELKAFVEDRLEAFGRDLADKSPPPVDVAPALGALSAELKAFMEARLERFGEDVSSRLANLPDAAALAAETEALRREALDESARRAAEAVAGLRHEMAALHGEISALKAALPAPAVEAPPTMDDLAGLRQETAALAKAVEALRGEVACRVTKVDQDVVATRIRMDMTAEMQAAIQKAVPAEAARIIREEIAALAREMDD